MNRLIALTVVLASFGCASITPFPPAAANRGRDGAPRSSELVREASVRAHMEFLASDALNGRASGSRDEWIAVTYVAAQLRRLGLEPMGDDGGYVQTIELERPELSGAPVLTLGDRRFTHGTGVSVTYMNRLRMTGPVARLEPGKPAGRGSVIVAPAFPQDRTLVAPAAMVLAKWDGCGNFRVPPNSLPTVATRIVGASPSPSRPACIALDEATYAAAEALPLGTVVIVEGVAKTIQKTRTWNAVGRLTGSDPAQSREVILLSAHIDHVGNGRGPAAAGGDDIYNGADDDASGSTAVLEFAQAFARGERPRRTIVFAWFGSEESGGAGSRFFADRPVVPLDRMVANLQFEMIGRPDPKVPAHTLWLTGYERSTLGPELAKRGAQLVQDPHPDQSFFTRSDNIQFARRGVIAHTVSSFGLHTDYHQPSDEIDTIDFAHMTAAIRSLVEPIRWLADSSFTPQWRAGQRPR